TTSTSAGRRRTSCWPPKPGGWRPVPSPCTATPTLAPFSVCPTTARAGTPWHWDTPPTMPLPGASGVASRRPRSSTTTTTRDSFTLDLDRGGGRRRRHLVGDERRHGGPRRAPPCGGGGTGPGGRGTGMVRHAAQLAQA